jgi:hypothetical protein
MAYYFGERDQLNTSRTEFLLYKNVFLASNETHLCYYDKSDNVFFKGKLLIIVRAKRNMNNLWAECWVLVL